MNNINLIGRIARELEMKEVGEAKVVNFTLAVNGNFNREKTNWIQCSAWNKTAEIMVQYLKKGSQVAIVGELQTDQYEKDGQKRTSFKVNVDRLDFLGKAGTTDEKPMAKVVETESNIDEDFPF